MGPGGITTETDITTGAWYLHHGRMPAGITIEAGQADLMLISWLGVDSLNKGLRVYRLLGCDLSFTGSCPVPEKPCDMTSTWIAMRYMPACRMFFFHYDCTCASQRRLTVRNGQAGFFTDENWPDPRASCGPPPTGAHTPTEQARMDPPAQLTLRRAFGPGDIRALSAGLRRMFRERLRGTYSHTRTAVAQSDRMQFLQRIPAFDPAGGPWKRGYLRAEWDVRPDDWFFEGHFKSDPCMPGTLMFEGCLQAMAFYLTALGFTIDRDGWRFEPVPDVRYSLSCRGQVLPSSKLLVYEVFVD